MMCLRVERHQSHIAIIKQSSLFNAQWYQKKYLNNWDKRISLAAHYYYVGWLLGYDPSEEFSTEYYISKYNDVNNARVNPLLHFLMSGRSEGRRKIPINYLKDNKNTDVLLFFGMPLNNSLSTGIVKLIEHVQSFDLKVFTYTNNANVLNEVKRSERVDFNFDENKNSQQVNCGIFDEFISEVAILNLLKSGNSVKNITESKCATNSAFRVWFEALKTTPPKLIIIWGSSSPLSRVLILLCRLLDIAYIILERGHLNDTFSSEVSEQWGRGRNLLSPQSNWSFKFLEYTVDDYQKIIDSRAFKIGGEDNSSCRVDCRRYVWLVLGCNDLGAGISTGSHDIKSKHSNFVNSTKELLSMVLETKKKLDLINVNIVFKPHPNDNNCYDDLSGFKLETEFSVEQLVSESSICFTIATTAGVNCLLYEKPLIQVGLSDMTNKGIVYQCYAADDLAYYAKNIMTQGHSDEMVNLGFRYINYLIKVDLIGYGDSIVNNNLIDFSKQLKKIVKGIK